MALTEDVLMIKAIESDMLENGEQLLTALSYSHS